MSVDSSPSPKGKWEISPESFAKLLSCLDPDAERAGEMFLKWLQKLARFFEWNHAPLPAEDLAYETLYRVARKMDEGEVIEHFSAYCKEIARWVLRESYKSREAKRESLDDVEPAVNPVNYDDDWEEHQRLFCLNECLQTIPPESRELVTEFYRGEGRNRINRRQSLADKLGIHRNALGNRIQRLLDKLEACIRKCLKKKKTAT